MRHKKICISKKIGYISLSFLTLLAVVLVNNRTLQTKTTYQSKAQAATKITDPSYKSIAPLKILNFWIQYRQFTLDLLKVKIDAYLLSNPISALNGLIYKGDLKFNVPGSGCSTLLSDINEPFGLLARQLNKSSSNYDSGFVNQPYISITLYESADGQEISLLATSWDNSDKPIAMRFFPFNSLVNAFSAMMYKQNGVPLETENIKVGVVGCLSGNIKRWIAWADFVINDPGVSNVLPNGQPTPTPNPYKERSAYQFQIDSKISEFMKKFSAIYKTSYPEVVLYPYIAPVEDQIIKVGDKEVQTYVPETMSTMSIPGNLPVAPGRAFTKTHPNGDITKGYDLVHLTYTFDKCNTAGATGNYYLIKSILEPKWEEYIEKDGTNQKDKYDTVTGLNIPLGVIQVIDRKTFINYPLAGVKPKGIIIPDCTKNYYDGDLSAPCPHLSKDIEFEDSTHADNAFFLTLKPIADSSCDYPKDANGYSMEGPITVAIYLGNP